MAIFESNLVQIPVTTPIGTTATIIWDPSNVSTTAFGPRGAVTVLSPAQTLKDVTIINTGTATLYIGGSTVTTATGLPIPVGGQVTIRGYTATAGTTTGRIYGVVTTAGTGNSEAGLETVDATN